MKYLYVLIVVVYLVFGWQIARYSHQEAHPIPNILTGAACVVGWPLVVVIISLTSEQYNLMDKVFGKGKEG